ncbi:UPF0369 protein C6orf57 [Batrachochytrium salamandrivorans]|nr:UPF0369 protein C6orf57 [Batrachochytrium salamandrivorans]
MWVGYASTQRAYTSGSSSPKSPTLPQSAFEKPGPLPLGNKQQQLEYEALLKEAELRSQADSLDSDKRHPDAEKQPLPRFPNNRNPSTGEIGGPRGVEPTRYGDWERKGRTYDF